MNEHTDEQTERGKLYTPKEKNCIPLGIYARGIMNKHNELGLYFVDFFSV